jgi:hypothetical protein
MFHGLFFLNRLQVQFDACHQAKLGLKWVALLPNLVGQSAKRSDVAKLSGVLEVPAG